MGRKVICTNNDLIILSRQINEFQENAEKVNFKLPASISYIVHRNEQSIMGKYSKYEEKRLELLRNHSELDEKGNPKYTEKQGENGLPEYTCVFKDEKKFDEEFNLLLQQTVELNLHQPVNLESKIEGVEGEQKILNQLWYLMDIFTNWNVNVTE